MINRKITFLMALITLLFALATSNVSATDSWSPEGLVVDLGGFSPSTTPVQSAIEPYVIGGMAINKPREKTSPVDSSLAIDARADNSSMNGTSLNSTSIDNSTISMPVEDRDALAAPEYNPEDSLPVIDLSGYSAGRKNMDLRGYTNIMYPFSESRGFTATTGAGGSSCGGSCSG